MRQEASESTETHEYGLMSIEYVNDHLDNNLDEQDPDDEFFEEDSMILMRKIKWKVYKTL